MPKVENVEKRIRSIEGFNVRFLHRDGSNVRGDMDGLPQYPKYERTAKNNMNVTQWKANRFKPNYPGFDVEILDGQSNPVHGATKLGSVRDSY